jgi:glutathione S-transferase
MALTVYYAPQTRAIRVLWALEELGIPYERVKLDLSKGEQKKPEYLALNPNGTVPTLVVDGLPMMESLAQTLFLAEKYGVAKKLWPAEGTPARAEALSWIMWMSETLGGALFRFVMNTNERVPAEQRNAAAAKAGRDDLTKCLGILEKRLETADYLVGGEFSLADLSCGALVFARTAGGVDMTPYPRSNAWVDRCTARAANKTAMSY